MNRIYIIGNGFDISHGLPTSYNDFVEFLIKKEFFIFVNELPKRIYDKDLNHHLLGKLVIKDVKIIEYKRLNGFIELGDYEVNYFKYIKNEIYNNPLVVYSNIFDVNSVNGFIRNIFNPKHILWGKIEVQYFEQLKRIHKSYKSNAIGIDVAIDKVIILNRNLEKIKNELVLYLKHVEEKNTNEYLQTNLQELFEEKINPKTVKNIKKNLYETNHKLNKCLFLNFNYTNTFKYLISNKLFSSQPYVINIHGEINNPADVIFGFGDENTNEYREIENSENVFLENIKSFKYLKNNEYDNLINFIHEDYFEVYLLGHSCSVTDRVLLKKIFENPKCLSIKIVPKFGDKAAQYINFKEISFNIARIFEDNGMMRDKVIPFECCNMSLPNIEKIKV